MKISDTLIDHLAYLSKLEFEGEEKQAIKQDMEKIIGFIDKLSEMDTQNTEPLIFMTEETNQLRLDEINTMITQGEALKNAPKKDSDYFRIPKVLDKN